ncbi:VOC family protein [Aurantivibrio plasticivorans]
MYIPPGFNTVTTYFIVKGADQFINFLTNGLGGVETLRHAEEDGRIAHAQVQIGDSTVMLCEATEDYPAIEMSLYLFVNDADESMKRSIAAGAQQVMPVSDQPYGDRQGGIKDTHGNFWWLSQRLIEAPYSV